uniref:Epithelial membrane protein 2 n=1 Tax=Astyanax mexicanus TaxID=7994 RepID=A0A8B9H9P5_ASTMX
MLVLLAGIFLLHITTFILLLAATIENAWWVGNGFSTDIWARWVLNGQQWNYTDLPAHYPAGKHIIFYIYKFNLSLCLSLSGLCIMIAASIYTDIFHKNEIIGNYGPSFILAWIAFALSFISCVIYFVLRKKNT